MTVVGGKILTIDKAATDFKASKRIVYALGQMWDIPAFKFGGTWRFRRSELDARAAESIDNKKAG